MSIRALVIISIQHNDMLVEASIIIMHDFEALGI